MSSTDRASWSLNNPDFTGWNFTENVMYRAQLVWDTVNLTWVKMSASPLSAGVGTLNVTGSGGGGGGGTQYAQGTVNPAPTGTVAMGLNAASGTLTSLATDASGNLLVNVAVGGGGGGGGSNAAAGQTGLAVPLYADYGGWQSGGNLVGTSMATALPVQPGTGATFPVSGTFWQATQPVSAVSLPLPTGAATAANQATEIASLATIATNTTPIATGQKTMANSEPVVIASDQSAVPVSGTFWQTTQPVSGTVSVGNFPATQPVSGSVSVSNFPASQAVTGTFWQATQPVSGTVNVGTRGWTLGSGTDSVTTVPSGTQTVSGTVTANQGGTWSVTDTTLAAITTTNPLSVAPAATNFFPSAANSSTAQLASNATFTGSAWDSTLSQQALSLLITSDQPLSVQILQAIDAAGAFQLPPITFTVAASAGVLRSFILNGNYLKLVVTNTGTGTTTLLNINTYYGTIAPSNNSGNEAVSLYDANGIPIGSGFYSGAAYLHVDTSHAATDGVAYSTANVPQVGVMAGRGLDGNVHPVQTDQQGRIQNQESGPQMVEVMRQILIEMRVMNQLLMDGLMPGQYSENVDTRRNDEDISYRLNG